MLLPRFWFALLPLLAACSEHQPAVRETAAPVSPAATAVTIPTVFDSTTVQVLPPNQVPADVPRPPGQVLEARQWTDNQGTNLLLITRTAPKRLPARPDDPNETQTVRLYARQYIWQAGKWREVWHLQDAVERCAFDTWLGPLAGATAVTDLDGDGQTETTLLYKLTCRSDVSPSALKLIMHEGAAKYALRGQMVVQYDSIPVSQRAPANPCCLDTISRQQLEAPDGYELYAGRYQSEKEFAKAPPAFLRFARQQWRRWSVRDEFEQF